MDTKAEQLGTLLALSPEAVFVFERAGTIVAANDAALELFGYRRAELIGKPVTTLVPADLHRAHMRGRDHFLAKPSRQPIASGQRVCAVHKSGREIPVEVMLGPFGSGGDLKIVCSVHDMTKRAGIEAHLRKTVEDLERRLRSSETEARRNNEHFKLFLKHAPAAIALLDRQMRYLIVSDRWFEYLGIATDRDLHGLCHYDLLPYVPDHWREDHRRCLNGEIVTRDEERVQWTDDRVDWVRREYHPWRTNDGRIGGMLMFVELATARKNAELALKKSYQELENRVADRTAALEAMKNDADRANAQKSWFVEAASHDLRQPLQASLAYLSVLSRKTAAPELEELCDKARQPLKAMGDILDTLLDISDLESGRVQPHWQDFPLNEVLERVVASAQHQAEEKGLRLSCLPTEHYAHSDPKLLERIISNFVTNAIRYTAKGLIGMYCDPVGEKICISVTDTGIGIPPDALAAIFEDHVQLANPARDRRKDLGLGLSIAKRIADSLGHRISVQSEVGSGSSFSIELPAAQASLVAVASPKAASPQKAAAAPPVVLLIDDDPDVAEAMQMLLQSYDFETYRASGRDTALAMLEAGLTPGLILCDYRLPGANGVEVIRHVRHLLNADVPAVLITGDMGLTVLPADLPAAAVLHKPVDVDAFFAALAAIGA